MSGKPGDAGVPGRYCPPAICYCGDCAWWKPMPTRSGTKRATKQDRPVSSWDDRDAETWIDKL